MGKGTEETSRKMTDGRERRKLELDLFRSSQTPLSGSELGRRTGVSRQVIVQDIALLRTAGYDVVSTARGYVLSGGDVCRREFKVQHTDKQIEEELQLIVDHGGCVEDVSVNHRTYGRISAPLGIKCRRDVKRFLDDIQSGKSSPLLNITSGYHFHNVTADDEETLDEIEAELEKAGFLAARLEYEE